MTYRLKTDILNGKDDIQAAMALIPAYEIRLNLSNNNLSSWSTELAGTLLESIPARIETVDLENNLFGRQSVKLDKAILKLHPGTKTLILDNNHLGSQHCIFSLKNLFTNCPKNLVKLSLGNTQLNLATISDLTEGFSAVNQELDELCLANNELGLKNIEDLQQLLSHLPNGLKKLSLAYNRLDMQLVNLNLIFSTINCSLEVLDLRGNNLECLTEVQLSAFCKALPRTVKSIRLSDSLSIDPILYTADRPFSLSATPNLTPPSDNSAQFSYF